MTTPAVKFVVRVADGKKVDDPKVEDKRTLTERIFLNKDGTPMEPLIIDTTKETPFRQGLSKYKTNGKIPVEINYMGAKEEFKGLSKGRDFITVGGFAGRSDENGNRGGRDGLRLELNDIPNFIKYLQALYDVVAPAVQARRSELGLGEAPVAGPLAQEDAEELTLDG